MKILGISCFYHDSAAALMINGQIVAAVQEERLNRKKHTSEFPIQAINYCLSAGDITVNDLDYIAFYEKPYLKFSRVIFEHLKSYPFSFLNFLRSIPFWLQERLIFKMTVENLIGYNGPVLYVPHHQSHAASSFFVSPFQNADIITIDGVGEYVTTAIGYGSGDQIIFEKELHFPDSLGLLYSAITSFLGFKVNNGEGKVMGLASYGKPVYRDQFSRFIDIETDGSFSIDNGYFGFIKGNRMYSRKFTKLFGKPRKPESELTERDYNLASTLQTVIEEAVIKIAKYLHKQRGSENIALSGGLFLNCLLNHKLLEKTGYKNIFIQPAAGDAGAAIGAALYSYYTLRENKKSHAKFVMKDAYLGPEYRDDNIERILLLHELSFKKMSVEKLIKFTANKIYDNRIIAWFQGRSEFGPRALGNRSILANPCNPEMKDILNKRVKHRENFRPFAPAVIEEAAFEYFELEALSPYMLLAAKVKKNKRSIVPAITHVDGTARVQTVNKKNNLKFWRLISEFGRLSGVPVLMNTSFNVRGEPIVCSPEDAVKTFLSTDIDYLVIESFVVEK